MGWRELTGWRTEMHRALTARVEGERSDPERWDGAERDPWWTEMRAKRERERA